MSNHQDGKNPHKQATSTPAQQEVVAVEAVEVTETAGIASTVMEVDAEAEGRFSRATARRNSERRASIRTRQETLGGARLKLAVNGEIPGYHLYWENDDEGKIEQLLYQGFDFVDPAEVSMASRIVSDTDLAKRVSRYVGTKADGSPMRAYLLKCPDELWAEFEAARNAQADAWDADIRGSVRRPEEGRYIPKGVDNSLDTEFRKEY